MSTRRFWLLTAVVSVMAVTALAIIGAGIALSLGGIGIGTRAEAEPTLTATVTSTQIVTLTPGLTITDQPATSRPRAGAVATATAEAATDTPAPSGAPTSSPTTMPPSSTAPAATAVPTQAASNSDGAYTVYDDSWNIGYFLNSTRCAQGLTPLTINQALTNAALNHSIDMLTHTLLSHTGSDGSDVGRRAAAQGYPWIVIGENIAGGQESVQEAFDAWMASDSHREAILTADFSEYGLGHIYSGSSEWQHYWTLVLGSTGSAPTTCASAGF